MGKAIIGETNERTVQSGSYIMGLFLGFGGGDVAKMYCTVWVQRNVFISTILCLLITY